MSSGPGSGVQRRPAIYLVEVPKLPRQHKEKSMRPRVTRAKTEGARGMKQRLRLVETPPPYWRPRVRADCATFERPCPYVGCKYHLYLDVNEETGSIKINFPDIEVEEMPISCALDVVDTNPGGLTLEQVGVLFALTRERVRQLEAGAFSAILSRKKTPSVRALIEHMETE